MLKKISCFILSLLLLFCFCGCFGTPPDNGGDSSSFSNSQDSLNTNIINPLTGIQNLAPEKAKVRPVTVVIDNDSVAQQNAQSGVTSADIVYETETEGGITRLLTVFADITKAPQLGDVRSARFVFINLAMGHNAILVHCGKDDEVSKAYLKKIDNFELATDYYAKRITYGAVRDWQTLFTTGTTLWEGFCDEDWQTEQNSFPLWQKFAGEKEAVALLGGVANKITCKFNSGAISYFTYDLSAGKYIKTSRASQNKDRNNSSPYAFENVIVMQTTMSYYTGGYRRDINLTSGSGYYATGGTYQKIKWKKGTETQPLIFMNEDGTPLKMSAGNTWVCIASNNSTITVE